VAGAREPGVDRLTRLALGSPPRYTAEELANEAGVSLAVTSQLWRAMGFADVREERAFTRRDLEMVRLLMGLVNDGLLTFDDVVDLVRGVGQTTARLAEWQAETIARNLPGPSSVDPVDPGNTDERSDRVDVEAGDGPALADLMEGTRALLPSLQRLVVYAWRRQLATALSRSAAGSVEREADVTTSQLTVGFADIVGFTRMARELPDEQLAELVESFDSISADVIAATGARLIKTSGDEILFVGQDAQCVAETALRLHEAQTGGRNRPTLRAGIATGSVISRMGDVYGTTVNRASRLTVLARPKSTFVDSETVNALEDDPGFVFRGVRPRPVRGLGLIRPWSLQRTRV